MTKCHIKIELSFTCHINQFIIYHKHDKMTVLDKHIEFIKLVLQENELVGCDFKIINRILENAQSLKDDEIKQIHHAFNQVVLDPAFHNTKKQFEDYLNSLYTSELVSSKS